MDDRFFPLIFGVNYASWQRPQEWFVTKVVLQRVHRGRAMQRISAFTVSTVFRHLTRSSSLVGLPLRV